MLILTLGIFAHNAMMEPQICRANIIELSLEASYIHCKAHQLNLALVHSSKEPCVRNMMSTVQEIALKFDYSAKRLTAFTDELSKNQNVKDQLERRTKLRTLCETRWSSRADSLYTFRTAFAVVVSALETLKADHDDKAAQCMNAILRFEFIVSLVVVEHILSSTVAITNYLQKPDIDLTEAMTEARVVIKRLSDEREDELVWETLLARARDMALEHDIQPCIPRLAGRQRHRANHHIGKSVSLLENFVVLCISRPLGSGDNKSIVKQRRAIFLIILYSIKVGELNP